jgi:4'-phosphopantetheinyl transferase
LTGSRPDRSFEGVSRVLGPVAARLGNLTEADPARVEITRIAEPRPGAIRRALSRHLGYDVREVDLDRDALGKPRLRHQPVGAGVELSVSHCRQRTMIAIGTAGAAIGIDVEALNPIPDMDGIAASYFTPEEACTIGHASGDRKVDAFFNCWTSKEAYTKALGTGLRTPLEAFAIRGATSSAGGVSTGPIRGQTWTLFRLAPWAGYTAAVVVAGRVPESAFSVKDDCVNAGH